MILSTRAKYMQALINWSPLDPKRMINDGVIKVRVNKFEQAYN